MSFTPFVPIPHALHISGNRLLHRPMLEYLPKRKKTLKTAVNEKNLVNNTPSGLFGRKQRQKSIKIIDAWIKALYHAPTNARGHKKHLPTFATLTLPSAQMHTDKDLNKALARFIQQMKRIAAAENYYWRAEKQKQTLTIHYHIIFDKFISWELIRNEWNKILNDLGYIDAYRKNQQAKHKNGFCFDAASFEKSKGKFNLEKQLNAYNKGVSENWTNPNSTDIHKLEKINNPASYICKYVTKSDEFDKKVKNDRDYNTGKISEGVYLETKAAIETEINKYKIEGRCWGCSDGIRDLKECVLPEVDFNADYAAFYNDAKENYVTRSVDLETITIHYCKDLRPLLQKHKKVGDFIKGYYLQMYYRLYPLPKRKEKPQKLSISTFAIPYNPKEQAKENLLFDAGYFKASEISF